MAGNSFTYVVRKSTNVLDCVPAFLPWRNGNGFQLNAIRKLNIIKTNFLYLHLMMWQLSSKKYVEYWKFKLNIVFFSKKKHRCVWCHGSVCFQIWLDVIKFYGMQSIMNVSSHDKNFKRVKLLSIWFISLCLLLKHISQHSAFYISYLESVKTMKL